MFNLELKVEVEGIQVDTRKSVELKNAYERLSVEQQQAFLESLKNILFQIDAFEGSVQGFNARLATVPVSFADYGGADEAAWKQEAEDIKDAQAAKSVIIDFLEIVSNPDYQPAAQTPPSPAYRQPTQLPAARSAHDQETASSPKIPPLEIETKKSGEAPDRVLGTPATLEGVSDFRTLTNHLVSLNRRGSVLVLARSEQSKSEPSGWGALFKPARGLLKNNSQADFATQEQALVLVINPDDLRNKLIAAKQNKESGFDALKKELKQAGIPEWFVDKAIALAKADLNQS